MNPMPINTCYIGRVRTVKLNSWNLRSSTSTLLERNLDILKLY